MRFGLVRLTLKIKSEPNQTKTDWVGSVGAVFFVTIQFFSNIKIKLKSGNTTYFQQCFKFHQILKFHFQFSMFSTTYTKLKTWTKRNPIL